MKFLHTMIRVLEPEKTVNFFSILGLKVIKKIDNQEYRFSLIFMATNEGEPEIELTHNWDETEPYTTGRNFGHLAFETNDIYKKCTELQNKGVIILRPPRDGKMAFIKSPDGISVELLQKGEPLEKKEPWLSMENKGSW